MALVEHSSQYRPRDPQPLPKRGPIYNIPVEILLKISQLLAPPRTRDGVRTLSELTHICRFWRVTLINQPRLWATVFVTRNDRLSFVGMCLERTRSTPLEVTIGVDDVVGLHPSCTCDRGKRGLLIPSQTNPCERHFVFECLAETKHSERIRTLNIHFENAYYPPEEGGQLSLGSCRFFDLPPPHLTGLEWRGEGTLYTNHLFSIPPFPHTLRSLSYEGSYHSQFMQVRNLTSFTLRSYSGYSEGISAETFRTFMLNNQSLETLSLAWVSLKGSSNGPPVNLSNLKSFSAQLPFPTKTFSTIVRVPALRHLSSLWITLVEDEYAFRATGDGIAFSVRSDFWRISEAWQDLTGYARPTIRHVRLHDEPGSADPYLSEDGTVISLLMDADTLEVGSGYVPSFYDDFWDDLKQLGPQLKTIRFEIPEEMEPPGLSDEKFGGYPLDDIEDLVRYRFEQGRPFSSVERMVVSESERVNRRLDFLWRCFYGSCGLDQYVRPE